MTSFTSRLTQACWLASIFSVHCYGDVKINDEYQPIATPKTYAILDISQDLAPSGLWNGQLPLNDTNQCAFAVIGTDGKDLTVYTWKPKLNGRATKAQTISLKSEIKERIAPDLDSEINGPVFRSSDIMEKRPQPGWLSADGVAYGYIRWIRRLTYLYGDESIFLAGHPPGDWWSHEKEQKPIWNIMFPSFGVAKAHKWTNGTAQRIPVPADPEITPVSENDLEGKYEEIKQCLKLNSSGDGGPNESIVAPGDSGSTCGFNTDPNAVSDPLITKTFVRSYVFKNEKNEYGQISPVFEPGLSNGMGAAIGAKQFWNGSEIIVLEGLAGGLNTQNQIIGYSYKTAGPTPSYGAFLFENGRMAYFNPPKGEENALIPKNVRGEIKGLSALSISNPDPKDGSIRVLLSGSFLIDPKAGTWASRYFVWQQEKNGQIGTITPLAIPDGMQPQSINANGLIAATGTISSDPSGKTHALLLFPVDLIDLNGAALDSGSNVSITPKKDANDTNPKSIAWIDPHRITNTHGATFGHDPDMPQLVLRLKGTEQMGLSIRWKLTVKYNRPNGKVLADDTVTIPVAASSPDGWVTEPLTGAVNIYQNVDWGNAAGTGFFGGDAELTYQILNASNGVLSGEQKILFSIGGKNPDPDLCKQFIQLCATSDHGNMWFAYAIARSESSDFNGNDDRYNQFWKWTGSGKFVAHKNGESTWSRATGETGPGGFGMFQVTGNKSSKLANIPRAQLWDWQAHVAAGLEILKQKRDYRAMGASGDKPGAWYWMNEDRYTNPDTGLIIGQRTQAKNQVGHDVAVPDRTVQKIQFKEGTNRVIEDAVTIKMYNGASANYCSWDSNNRQWKFNNTNMFGFDYVDRVCQEMK